MFSKSKVIQTLCKDIVVEDETLFQINGKKNWTLSVEEKTIQYINKSYPSLCRVAFGVASFTISSGGMGFDTIKNYVSGCGSF